MVLIILIAVVPQALVPGVERFLLMRAVLLLTILGLMVPSYHLNLVYRVIIFIEIKVVIDLLLTVVTPVVVPIVVLSMLMLTVMPLMLIGLLALPYHLNQLVIIFIEIPVQDMYIAVVSQALVPTVGLSLLLVAMILLLPPGILELLYHLNLV